MESDNGHAVAGAGMPQGQVSSAWLAFIHYCRQMGFGEIERLRIQDGVPVLAEVATRKVKFGS